VTAPEGSGMFQILFRTARAGIRVPGLQRRGQIVVDACHKCDGTGRQASETTVTVDIPAGVSEGNYLSVRARRLRAQQRPAGDLIVLIQEEKDKFFERHGIDVVCEINISFAQAALGTSTTVPTLDGKVSLKFPRARSPKKYSGSAARACPWLHSSQQGDQLVKLHVQTRKNFSKKSASFLKNWLNLKTRTTRAGLTRSGIFFRKNSLAINCNQAESC